MYKHKGWRYKKTQMRASTIALVPVRNKRRVDRTIHIDKNGNVGEWRAYGNEYTKRQLQILSGEIPLETVRTNEITLLANKAKYFGDAESCEIATALREKKKHQNDYTSIFSPEKARQVLKMLDQIN